MANENLSQALQKAIALKVILDEQGVQNESLDTLINELQNLPSAEVLNEYNRRILAFQEASGQSANIETGQALIDHYNRHADELSAYASDIKKVQDFVNLLSHVDNEIREINNLVRSEGH